MMSCGGTSSVSVRSGIRYSVSIGQKTIRKPAGFALGCILPNRSTTPRSHSLITYSEFQNQIRNTNANTIQKIEIASNIAASVVFRKLHAHSPNSKP
jgi:hypothetical protein